VVILKEAQKPQHQEGAIQRQTMKKHRFSASLLLGIFLAIFFPNPVQAAETCATLLTGRCETCHYLTRVCEKVAQKKGKWSWKRTVKNMVRQGAKLNSAEQDRLVVCLSEPAPEVKTLCNQSK